MSAAKVLLVDDEPRVLEAIARQLNDHPFELHTAASGAEAISMLAAEGPFEVVMSDLNMPNMDGVELLKRTGALAPETTRIMLTGQTEQDAAARAVNEGAVFRFLTKPSSPEDIAEAIAAGVEAHRGALVERKLLVDTLAGVAGAFAQVLSIVNPTGSSRGSRVRKLAGQLAKESGLEDPGEVELAAVLSQIGLIVVSETTLRRVIEGEPLSGPEIEAYQSYPQIGADLLARIPRLASIAAIVAHHQRNFDGSDGFTPMLKGEAIPRGARIVKVAIDFDALVARGYAPNSALGHLDNQSARYDPDVMGALRTMLGRRDEQSEHLISPDELEPAS